MESVEFEQSDVFWCRLSVMNESVWLNSVLQILFCRKLMRFFFFFFSCIFWIRLYAVQCTAHTSVIEKTQSEGAFSGLNWHWIAIIDRNRSRRRRRYRAQAQVLTTWRKASAECQAWPVLPPCSCIMKLFLLVAELFLTCPHLYSYLLTFVLICPHLYFYLLNLSSNVLFCPLIFWVALL